MSSKEFKKDMQELRKYYFALPKSFRYPFQSACQTAGYVMLQAGTTVDLREVIYVFMLTLTAQILVHVSKLKD